MLAVRTDDYRDFKERQLEIRESFDPMLTLPEVRRILGVSYAIVTELIRDGHLRAYDITGRTVDKAQITEHSRGLRVLPDDLRKYLDSREIS